MYMPYSLRILCLTNLFCWMSLVCYSLYFTDFVGEAVFGGDPSAAPGSEKRRLYDQGVQFGCWGMYYNGAKSLAMNLYFFIHAFFTYSFTKKKNFIINFHKKATYTLLIVLIVKSLQIELHSTNLLL